jgi:hypothetical protein
MDVAAFEHWLGEIAALNLLQAAYCVVPGAPISSGLSDFEA